MADTLPPHAAHPEVFVVSFLCVCVCVCRERERIKGRAEMDI